MEKKMVTAEEMEKVTGGNYEVGSRPKLLQL